MASDLLRTNDIAKTLGIHANTVRNYEKWGYLPQIPRGENGYRAFSAVHLEHARLACLGLQWPYLGERAPLVRLVQSAASGDFSTALEGAYDYLAKIRVTQVEAETAVHFLEHWASGNLLDTSPQKMTVSQAAEHLNVTVDMLRNWERNGLIVIPRQPSNQYRLYGAAEFARLRAIRRLVQSGFSLMAISRMLQQVDAGSTSSLREALELPRTERANEAIDIMGDHWLSSLQEVAQRAQAIIEHIAHLIELVHSS
jgi:DNA-binding transcriptional MerR regulator